MTTRAGWARPGGERPAGGAAVTCQGGEAVKRHRVLSGGLPDMSHTPSPARWIEVRPRCAVRPEAGGVPPPQYASPQQDVPGAARQCCGRRPHCPRRGRPRSVSPAEAPAAGAATTKSAPSRIRPRGAAAQSSRSCWSYSVCARALLLAVAGHVPRSGRPAATEPSPRDAATRRPIRGDAMRWSQSSSSGYDQHSPWRHASKPAWPSLSITL